LSITTRQVHVLWPNGHQTIESSGTDWLQAAADAGIAIPTGCLSGSCGACEIEVNGKVVRACISTVPPSKSGQLTVEFATDPYW
jgi:ferredoxin